VQATIHPKGHIEKTSLRIPPSKSVGQRALAAALLAKGSTHVINLGQSHDEMAVLSLLQQMGAELLYANHENRVEINSSGLPEHKTEAHIGESGLATRLFVPILALSKAGAIIHGKGSILKRPMDYMAVPMKKLGIEVKSTGGYLPLQIDGTFIAKDILVDGSMGSQFISGLLYALAFAADKEIKISVEHMVSTPYLDLTIDVLSYFGVQVHREASVFVIPAHQKFVPCTFHVESDWSSASCMLAAAAIGGHVIFKGLQRESRQADKAFLDALEQFGANIHWSEDGLCVRKKEALPFEFDATHCPDLFPALACLASFAQGVSKIKGVHRLEHKESNRSVALQTEFGKAGVQIILEADEMLISGCTRLQSAIFDSHNDHRIAMACSILSIFANGSCQINRAEAIQKSYPGFYNDLMQLGINIEMKEEL
jgi:3-phosphoshikimate 1-carboxyvinyltransferase